MSTKKETSLIEVSKKFDPLYDDLMSGDITPQKGAVVSGTLSGQRRLHADSIKYSLARGEKPKLDFYECQ